MRFRSAGAPDARDAGRRVSIRRRLPDGSAADVLGTLVDADPQRYIVRTTNGDEVAIARDAVIAARVVRAPAGKRPRPSKPGV